jgi:para-nitrobenzyl esterase
MAGRTTIDRRGVLALGAGLAASAGLARAEPLATAVTRNVKTTNGPVFGLEAEGVSVFKGLRYGAPPVGALRFAAPRKPAPWTDPAGALGYGRPAIQQLAGGGAASYPGAIGPALGQLKGWQEDVFRQGEDCLFLNVWTPGLDNKARPVMVWFHGGGYSYGSGAWPQFEGYNLAKRHDVVVVTVNHRLNAFGYLNVAELGGDPSSGSAGVQDLVLVLEWVKDNIAAFGGSPDCVTTFGQSGGGAKSGLVMTMPAAKGLVHRAIIESGPTLTVGDRAAAADLTRRIMAKIGVKDLAGLQAAPFQAVLDASADVRWEPVLDGVAIQRHPYAPDANPQIADIPVVVGCTSDEMTLYNVGRDWWPNMTEADLVARLRPHYAEKTEAIVAAAKRQWPNDSPRYLYTGVLSQAMFIDSAKLAERKAAQRAPVYMYVWEWRAPVEGGMLRAPHSVDVGFVFDNVDKGPMLLGRDPSTFALGKAVSSAWTAFARTGDPNVAGSTLPRWPKFTSDRRETMIINARSRIASNPYAELRTVIRDPVMIF